MAYKFDKFALVLYENGIEACRYTAPTKELCKAFGRYNADCLERMGLVPLPGISLAIIEL